MNAEDELLLRREVRAAVFRTERLRRAGRETEASGQLQGELAATRARLAALGRVDTAGTVHRWRAEDEAAFDLAALIGDLMHERAGASAPARPPAAVFAPSLPSPPPVRAAPAGGIPGLADLLDDMLTQERSRPRT